MNERFSHPDFEESLHEETSELVVERSRVLVWSSLLLFSTFWFLDYFLAGDLAFKFLRIRMVVAVLYLLMLIALHSKVASKIALPLTLLGAISTAMSIAIMSAFLGGFASVYFVGIIIVVVVVPMIVPLGFWSTFWMSSLTLLGYLAINLYAFGPSREMVAPVFFLGCITAFSCVASLSQERTRRRDLSLRLRLEEANRELKELDEAKTRLFANVSHELRTPLTLVLGPLQTLIKRETNGEARQVLDAMAKNARRLLRQVDALLDVAKLQSGRLRLELLEGSLGEILEELIEAAIPHAQTRGILLDQQGLDELPDFVFDPDKVEMIAANLISNALKFTLPGGTVRILASANEESVVFSVSDNGIGIPEQQLDLVFDRFHQVDNSTQRSQEGTGLGLALAKELAQLHGGDVTVASKLNEGSTFRVELPMVPVAQQPDRRRKPRRRQDQLSLARMEAIKAHEFANRSRRHTLLADVVSPATSEEVIDLAGPSESSNLLVVDDNTDLRNYMARELAPSFSVSMACDGKEALELLLNNSFDLVVTDVMMPVMDGHELCRLIRSHPRLSNLPVILVTARAGEDAVVEGLDVGADDYVTKPFDIRELEARIRAHLRAKEVERRLYERDSRLSAIGRMTSSLVHDLRNPLTLVKGHADLAQHFAGRPETLDSVKLELEGVQDAADRLRQRVEEILDYSRGGLPDLQTREVQARELIEEVFPPLLEELSGWNIDCKFENQVPTDSLVLADRGRLERVFGNLITNARETVRDSSDKKVSVYCSAQNHQLTIEVKDSGPTFEEGSDLFEPSLDNDEGRGHGLALATVKNLVRAHGGAVDAEANRILGGNTIRVLLPLLTHDGLNDNHDPLHSARGRA